MGLLTHQADSYLTARLPSPGTYFVYLSDAQHHGGDEYAYRLRVGPPRPDFALRLTPSSLNMPPLIDVVPFVCEAPVALQEGFLRYPQQTQTSVGPRFPGIECFR